MDLRRAGNEGRDLNLNQPASPKKSDSKQPVDREVSIHGDSLGLERAETGGEVHKTHGKLHELEGEAAVGKEHSGGTAKMAAQGAKDVKSASNLKKSLKDQVADSLSSVTARLGNKLTKLTHIPAGLIGKMKAMVAGKKDAGMGASSTELKAPVDGVVTKLTKLSIADSSDQFLNNGKVKHDLVALLKGNPTKMDLQKLSKALDVYMAQFAERGEEDQGIGDLAGLATDMLKSAEKKRNFDKLGFEPSVRANFNRRIATLENSLPSLSDVKESDEPQTVTSSPQKSALSEKASGLISSLHTLTDEVKNYKTGKDSGDLEVRQKIVTFLKENPTKADLKALEKAVDAYVSELSVKKHTTDDVLDLADVVTDMSNSAIKLNDFEKLPENVQEAFSARLDNLGKVLADAISGKDRNLKQTKELDAKREADLAKKAENRKEYIAQEKKKMDAHLESLKPAAKEAKFVTSTKGENEDMYDLHLKGLEAEAPLLGMIMGDRFEDRTAADLKRELDGLMKLKGGPDNRKGARILSSLQDMVEIYPDKYKEYAPIIKEYRAKFLS